MWKLWFELFNSITTIVIMIAWIVGMYHFQFTNKNIQMFCICSIGFIVTSILAKVERMDKISNV
jgi:hypothetical protein